MPALHLTPASISYLTQLILSVAITSYLALRMRLRENRSVQSLHLTSFFTVITLFIGLLFLESASLPTQRLPVVFLETTALALAVVFLLQFAYRFPAFLPRRKWESYIVLWLSLVYALWEGYFAVFRFVRLQAGEVLYRNNLGDYALLAFLLWVPLVFLRQYVALAIAGRHGWRNRLAALLRPENPEARAAGALALIYLFIAGLSVVNILRDYYLLSVSLASMIISLGILLALFAFSMTYLNYQKEGVSFMVKLAGTTLIVVLALLGIVGWVILPAYEGSYHPILPDRHTLRFTPNELGGYDISEAPFAFETGMGNDYHLSDGPSNSCAALDFEFLFYGQTYSRVYACNDGTLGMGRQAIYRDYQYRYGAGVPLIMPLLTDLYPEISTGGVFVLQEAERLVITWDRLRGFYRTEMEFTLQLTLYHSGIFEIGYNGLPPADSPLLAFHPNDEPGANVWAIGAVPGGARWNHAPQAVSLTDLPLRSGPDGVVQDYLLEFRQHLNELFVPLAWLVLAASILIMAGFPLLFFFNIVRPLKGLLDGVRKMDAGNLNVQVPVLYNDEIGSLTGSFNHLAEQLHSLVSDLDARVVTRTAELTAANEQLRQKLDEIQHLQEQLREQAIRDPLTNLFNRRYLQETLVREIAQAERRKWNIGIIMMDIDRFKQVNDSRGHHVGDQVLQEFGKLLVSGVRKGDIACRLGGEEFMVIIPSASLESTFQRANEICNAFEALSARIIQNPKVHVTISAGVVIYPTHGADYDTLLQNADSALYLAKHLGRNRVEVLPGR